MIIYSVYTRFWELYWQDDEWGEKAIKDEAKRGFVNRMFDFLKTIPDQNLEEFVYNDPAWLSTWGRSLQADVDFTKKEYLEIHQRVYFPWIQEARV
jgi:hypothetical protein